MMKMATTGPICPGGGGVRSLSIPELFFSATELLFIELERALESLLCFLASLKAVHLDHFILQILVSAIEVFYLLQRMRIDILHVPDRGPAGVVFRYSDNLVVRVPAVDHVHDRYRASAYQDARNKRISSEHNDIERIAVIPERLRHETIVNRERLSGIRN